VIKDNVIKWHFNVLFNVLFVSRIIWRATTKELKLSD